MKPLHTKLHTETSNLYLTREERDSMRQVLRAHMHTQAVQTNTPSPYHFLHVHQLMAFVGLLLLIVLGGGSSIVYAAQGSLPGDLLYPVKINVNEEVQTALATTPTQKAQVHTALAERRLEEAQTLAYQGKLDAPTTAQIASNLNVHATEAKAIAVSIAETNPEESEQITTQLTSSLAANNEVLTSLGDQSNDAGIKDDTQKLAEVVQVHIVLASATSIASAKTTAGGNATPPNNPGPEKVATLRPMAMVASSTSENVHTSTTTSKESLAASSTPVHSTNAAHVGERATKELQVLQDQIEAMSTIDASTTVQLKAAVSSIKSHLAQGSVALAAGDDEQAAESFNAALAASVRLQTLLRAAARLSTKIITPVLDKDATTSLIVAPI